MNHQQRSEKAERSDGSAKKQRAFNAAYASCHEPFIRYCSALGYGKMDTEDLVQDVLLSAYQHFERIERQDQLLHYLLRAARNRSISRFRRRKYQPELLEKHAARLKAKGATAEQLVDVDLIYRALDRLPTKQRQALFLFEVLGFKMLEIAELQGASVGAVKTKISRGRQKVRRMLADTSSPNTTTTPIWAAANLLLL
ncbi:MAG: RNA polymerase sigma factor [Bacteroidota bacterium]